MLRSEPDPHHNFLLLRVYTYGLQHRQLLLKNCHGPCQHFESVEDYKLKIDQIKNILKGHLKKVKEFLLSQMNGFAENMEFEKAHQCKIKLNAFEDYQGKSTVVSTSIKDVDVFSIAYDDQEAYIHFLKVIDLARALNNKKKLIASFHCRSLHYF